MPDKEQFDPYRKWLGIPPEEQPPHHYRLLGIGLYEGDPDVIEAAADRQMSHVQTYKTGKHSSLSQKLLNELAAAKLCLLNRERKKAYDAALKERLNGAAAEAASPPVATAVALDAQPNSIATALEVASEVGSAVVVAPQTGRTSTAGMNYARQKQKQKNLQIIIGGLVVGVLVLGTVAFLILSGGDNTAANNTPGPGDIPDGAPPDDGGNDASTGDGGTGGSTTGGTARPVRPKPPVSPGAVDLLAQINPRRDSLAGEWRLDGWELVSPEVRAARVQLPAPPGPAYELTLSVERVSGQGRLGIGLVVGNAQCSAVLDGDRGQACGLELIEGKAFSANGTTRRRPQALAQGKAATIVCTVRPDAVSVSCDGSEAIAWSGDAKKLSLGKEIKVPARGRLCLSAWDAVFRVSRIEVKTLGSGQPWVVQPQPTGQAVDLLAQVDIEKHATTPGWTRQGDALVSPDDAYSFVRLPYDAPPRFKLTLEVTRLSGGEESLNVVLANAAVQVMYILDGFKQTCSGLDTIDGKRVPQNESRRPGIVLEDNKTSVVELVVDDGRIIASVDGQVLTDWRGDFKRLGLFPNAPLGGRGLYVGAFQTAYRISKAELAPLGGGDSADPAQVTVDVLEAIDLERDSVAGEWELDDGALACTRAQDALLRLPVDAPASYRLTVEVERTAGEDAFAMLLPIGTSRVAAALDGWRRKGHGLSTVNGQDDGNPTIQEGALLTSGEPRTVTYEVSDGRSITVRVDGEQVIHWTGNPRTLGIPGWLGQVPDDHRFYLRTFWSSFRITRLELGPLESGGAEPMPPTQAADLLAQVDLDRDVVRERWELDDDALVTPPRGRPLLRLPAELPDAYAVTLEAERTAGEDALVLFLNLEGHQFGMAIDGWTGFGGSKHGLFNVDGQEFDNRTLVPGTLLTRGRRHQVVVVVRRGAVVISVDGQQVNAWEGDAEELSLPPGGWNVPADGQLYVGSNDSSFRLTRIDLAPIALPRPPVAEPVDRSPVPDDEALAAARQTVQEAFKEDFAAAKTADEKAALAEQLLTQAGDDGESPAARHVLLSEARDLAIDAGRPELVGDALDALIEQFEVDGLALQHEAYTAVAKKYKPEEGDTEFSTRLLELAEVALLIERLDVAAALATLARTETLDADLKKLAETASARIRRLEKEQAAIAVARATLAQSPDDPAANLVVGRYLCLLLDDWEQGLTHLALGGDDPLAVLARQDQTEPTESAEIVALADGWWNWAEQAEAADREPGRARARVWYQLAVDDLAGVEQKRVQTRLGVEETGDEPSTAEAGTGGVHELLFKRIATALERKKLSRSGIIGLEGNGPFESLPEEGGILVGMNLAIRQNGPRIAIQALQPVYLTPEGTITGEQLGRTGRGTTPVNMVAKDGYAVAAIFTRGQYRLEGFGLRYAKIGRTGLNLRDTYDSEWRGDERARNPQSLESAKPIVGLFGTLENELTSLGVIALP
jgi:hypothetical protein